MTVTIRRPPPGFKYRSNVATTGLYSMLPFEVDVIGSEARGDYKSTCQCREVLRVSDDSVSWLMKRGVLSEYVRGRVAAGKNPCVCKCMTEVRDVVGKPGRPRIGDRQVTRMEA